MSNKVNFSISSYGNSDTIHISTPLRVSYFIDEKYTVDNNSGIVYPNTAVVHKKMYELVSRVYDLLKNTAEEPVYNAWDWTNWYVSGSLVYIYDSTTSMYKFYKAAKMTNPLISVNNTTYWNSYTSPIWSPDYSYVKGTVVHTSVDGIYSFYESLKNVVLDIEITNIEYWRPMNLEVWSYDKKYNIGSKVYVDEIVYTTIKTILPVTKIDNRDYWSPFFNYYALISLAENKSIELNNSLGVLDDLVEDLKEKFEINLDEKTNEEIAQIYEDMYNLNNSIQIAWQSIKSAYAGMTKEITSSYGLLWKNIHDTNVYIRELNLYNVDPIRVLESIRYLDSFQELLNSDKNKEIVAYVDNLYLQQDPSQKNGAYFIYDLYKNRFIKALVGQHDHKNKEILDEIGRSLDEISNDDNTDAKVLVIRKEASESDGMSWDYHVQWHDINLVPPKNADGKEYLLKFNQDGLLEWTDKISCSAAFIKKEKEILSESSSTEFDVSLSFDNDGNVVDSILLFKNNLYVNNFTYDYNEGAKILTISLSGEDIFNEGDMLTLLLIRNTSAEMLSKLSDQYVSKKEAIEILSNGTIDLKDYVKKESLAKYSLKNHMHARYTSKDHSHTGIYADYYHNHDGLYMTRDNINELLGNILSINPELVNLISSIAGDLETLNQTFVSKLLYDDYVSLTNQRINDLESIDDKTLYIDTNTGQVSRKINNENSIVFEPVSIESYQIKTKYKITDDEEETEVYDLEDWLEYVLGLIDTEESRIKKIYNLMAKSDKVVKTYTLSSVENQLVLDKFTITDIKLNILEEFDNPISILLDGEILIGEEDIVENEVCISTYGINMIISSEKVISFNIDPIDTGMAFLIITGYHI